MKVFLVFLLALATSGCLAEQNEEYVEKYRTIKDELDSELVYDLEVLLFYLSTWRQVKSKLNELKEGTSELINYKPITQVDAFILLDELKIRAKEYKIPLDITNKTSISVVLQELLVKPCNVYRKAFEVPLFRQVEIEDPKLESYYHDDSKMDFYTGWATLKMCINLIEKVEDGSLLESMQKKPSVDYNTL